MKEKNKKTGKKNWKMRLVAVLAALGISGYGIAKITDGAKELKEVIEESYAAEENAEEAEVEVNEYMKKIQEELERKKEENKVTIYEIKDLYCSEYNKMNLGEKIDSNSIEIIEKWVDCEKLIAIRYATEGKNKKYIDVCDSINKKIDEDNMRALGISEEQNNIVIGKIPEGTEESLADILQKYTLMNEYAKSEGNEENYKKTRDELRTDIDKYKEAIISKDKGIEEEGPDR